MTDLSQYGDCLIEVERQKIEIERQSQLIDTWRIALRTIAGGDMQDGRWGRIALEALDKERKP